MNGEPSTSSSVASSLSMSTVASTLSTSYATVPPSVPLSVTITTSSATPTTSNGMFSASTLFSSDVGGRGSLLPTTTSVISDPSLPLISGPSAGTSSNPPTLASQDSLYPETSVPTQTNATNEQAQTTSSAPVSAMTSANRNVSEQLPLTYSPIGASTQPGGALGTNTLIGTISSGNSFFDNRGAVVGSFVVVAIFSTAMFACLCVAWRRRLRRRTRDRMIETITLPKDDVDRGLRGGPHGQPRMSMINDGPTFTARISVPATGNTKGVTGLQYNGPFSNYFPIDRTSRGLAGLAVAANSRIDSPVPSSAPSTPSIYPPSLPPTEAENNIVGPMVYSIPLSTPTTNPPPRPPRRRRPPPLPSSDLIEAVAMPSSQTMPVSFTTVVPASSSQYTPKSFSSLIPVRDANHNLSKIYDGLQSQTPPSTISDCSQTNSQPCNIEAAAVLDHPTNIQLQRASTLFLRRTLDDTRAVPRDV